MSLVFQIQVGNSNTVEIICLRSVNLKSISWNSIVQKTSEILGKILQEILFVLGAMEFQVLLRFPGLYISHSLEFHNSLLSIFIVTYYLRYFCTKRMWQDEELIWSYKIWVAERKEFKEIFNLKLSLNSLTCFVFFFFLNFQPGVFDRELQARSKDILWYYGIQFYDTNYLRQV